MRLKYLDFAKFHYSQDRGGQKIENLSQIFKGNSNFLILPHFVVTWTSVVKISNSSQIFNATQSFWFCQIS